MKLRTSMLSGISHVAFSPADDGGEETLGVIELEGSLADAEKPPELPAGIYTGEITDVSIPTSAKGNQYFAVKFVIAPEELPADIAEFYDEGAILFWNRTVVPNGKDRRALFNLRKFVEAIGLPLGTSVDPNEWMGQRARLKVVMGKYQGEERAEIKSLEAADSAKPRAAAAKAAPAKAKGRR